MNELLPRLGDVVLYHDPDTARVVPAMVVHVYAPAARGEVALCVFTLDGEDTVRHVTRDPGEFGHWEFRPGG
jgi:hypothetical protein